MRGEKESHDGGAVLLEGMIVKTGLQDATKNVRIYGTISAVSSPNHRPTGPPTPAPACLASPRLASRTPSSTLPPVSFLLPPSRRRRFPECARPPARPHAVLTFLAFLFSSFLAPRNTPPSCRLPAPRFPLHRYISCTLPYLRPRSPLPAADSPH